MGNPVVHFEITAKNIERLHDFYSKVFGWKIDANNPFKYGMTDTGAGTGINGGIGETTGNGHVTIYGRCRQVCAPSRAEKCEPRELRAQAVSRPKMSERDPIPLIGPRST